MWQQHIWLVTHTCPPPLQHWCEQPGAGWCHRGILQLRYRCGQAAGSSGCSAYSLASALGAATEARPSTRLSSTGKARSMRVQFRHFLRPCRCTPLACRGPHHPAPARPAALGRRPHPVPGQAPGRQLAGWRQHPSAVRLDRCAADGGQRARGVARAVHPLWVRRGRGGAEQRRRQQRMQAAPAAGQRARRTAVWLFGGARAGRQVCSGADGCSARLRPVLRHKGDGAR